MLDHTGQEGGAELAMVRLAAELRRCEIDVQVLLFSDGPLRIRLEELGIPTRVEPLGIRTVALSRDMLGWRRAILETGAALRFSIRIARAIRCGKADLVVANSLKAASIAAVAAPAAGRPWIWHLHDRLSDDYLPPLPLRALKILAAVGPARIVANSRATRETLPSRARRRSAVVYPGFRETCAAPASDSSAAAVGIVGRISPTKGQLEFIEAAAQLAHRYPNLLFRVIGAPLFGEESYEHTARERATDLGIADRLEFCGWVEDPLEQMKSLSVLVHASPVPEPFGQVLIEAMAAGVPVVAAASGGVMEILDPTSQSEWDAAAHLSVTDVGILVRPGDPAALAKAIATVLDDPVAATQRVQKARSSLARFDIERTAAGVAEVWSSILPARRWFASTRSTIKTGG
ncbi:glycosyltransferase family 4 protein [Paramicrobacterium humi]|nr:glycosyltransferase family 4 protein [Microbacterium humi]